MLFANLQICCGGCLQIHFQCVFLPLALFMGLSKVCRRKPSKIAITFIVCLSPKKQTTNSKNLRVGRCFFYVVNYFFI